MQAQRSVVRILVSLLVCLWSASIARAQGDTGVVNPSAPPAYLSVVNGAATLERDREVEPAVVNMPVVEGDILRTTSGRVEVVFPDGSAIEIDPDSEIEFISATRVRVIRGAMEHRIAEARDTRSASADYLPQDLRMYGSTLDRNGSWQYEAPYGNVWYPTVTPDWRPYYEGSWSSVPSYGWTWVGVDAWSWPTHHYGRWGYNRNRWFWIPGRTWSAAWVSWASASDYVSWCPLGFDGRPVFGLSAGYNRGWNGWTVMARNHFGARGAYTPRYNVDPRRIASNTPFIEHGRAPVAMPRNGRQSSPIAGRQPHAGRRQSPGESLQSPDGSRQNAVERRQPTVGSPGQAVPRSGLWTTDPRAAVSGQPRTTIDQRPPTRDARPRTSDPRSTPNDSRPTLNDQRPTTNDQRPTTNDQRLSTPGYRSPDNFRAPSYGYRPPSAGYNPGVSVAVPRSEPLRPERQRAEVPPGIPPNQGQIMGNSQPAVRSPDRARPAPSYQPPPAAYRSPPSVSGPPPSAPRPQATESRPANGARAPERAAPASAPERAAPRSGGESGRPSGAPAGSRRQR